MRNDETLGRDLRAAAGRDLPGEEFDRRVLTSIEGGGGETVISVRHRHPRWRIAGLAAAVALVALGIWAVGSGQIRREAPADGGEVDVELAKGIELPVAGTSAPWPRPIRIAITKEGKLRIDGRPVDHSGLVDELRKETQGTHDATRASRPSRRLAVLLADRRVRWREVQWAMQALADPSVRIYRIHFATEGTGGSRRVLPAFLPVDRGLGGKGALKPVIEDEVIIEDDVSDAPFQEGPSIREEPVRRTPTGEKPRIIVELKRKKGETRTRYVLLDQDLPDEAGCVRRIAHIVGADPTLPLEINGWAEVPFEDVVRILDAYRKTGRGGVTFVGAPPPPKGR